MQASPSRRRLGDPPSDQTGPTRIIRVEPDPTRLREAAGPTRPDPTRPDPAAARRLATGAWIIHHGWFCRCGGLKWRPDSVAKARERTV
jgi:hypothetical protein